MPTLNWVFKNSVDSQVAVNNLVADKKVLGKRGAGGYLYIHLYHRSVLMPSKLFKKMDAVEDMIKINLIHVIVCVNLFLFKPKIFKKLRKLINA